MLVVGVGMGSYFFFRYAAVGTVRLLITDPPAYDAGSQTYDPSIKDIVVTFTMVEIHAAQAGSDSGWHSLRVSSTDIHLLEVLNVAKVIGSASLPTGKYDAIRLFANTVRVVIDGRNVTFRIPSGGQTGIKVPIVQGGFMLSMGQTVNVLLTLSFNSHELLANGTNITPVVRAEAVAP